MKRDKRRGTPFAGNLDTQKSFTSYLYLVISSSSNRFVLPTSYCEAYITRNRKQYTYIEFKSDQHAKLEQYCMCK